MESKFTSCLHSLPPQVECKVEGIVFPRNKTIRRGDLKRMKNMNRISRRAWLTAVCAAVAAPAKDGVEPINKARKGLAAKGYDVVAYFTNRRAVKGLPQFMTEWMGAVWYFATAENREQFLKDPAKFAPQFGGYCAWAVGHGYTADIDPEAWHITDGKLYLNYNKGIQTRWLMDKAKWIGEGEKNWPGLHR